MWDRKNGVFCFAESTTSCSNATFAVLKLFECELDVVRTNSFDDLDVETIESGPSERTLFKHLPGKYSLPALVDVNSSPVSKLCSLQRNRRRLSAGVTRWRYSSPVGRTTIDRFGAGRSEGENWRPLGSSCHPTIRSKCFEMAGSWHLNTAVLPGTAYSSCTFTSIGWRITVLKKKKEKEKEAWNEYPAHVGRWFHQLKLWIKKRKKKNDNVQACPNGRTAVDVDSYQRAESVRKKANQVLITFLIVN